MHSFVTILMVGLLFSPFSLADLWVSKGNFGELPFYTERDERKKIDGCSGEVCETGLILKKTYFKANLVSNESDLKKLFGVWTGGDCQSDTWKLKKDGGFASKYPLEGEIYSWSGSYFLEQGVYVEEGKNNKGEREYNEAYLYYVPAKDLLIYKGLRGFDGYDQHGNEKFVEFSGPDFYYFRRCDSLTSG
ncbi:hypothetical protein [Marinobacter sp. CHS3-4]|uniref:hypothetical protein n=1 Tax=Marinobacter sp. CHS3-4 TaxID=3045174 RepID=UPI0024B5403F|nr:hypothetical protein [Marinobacter sp. CHS3-4]MDI9246954.1 hypothetical protein [Marinobacter sp. CHS3-4]